MMKKIILFVVFIINIITCTAPVLSEEQREEKERLVERRIEEWEKEQKKEQEFIRWSNDLGHEESRNQWWKINKIGCFGEHQWKESTLRSLGYKITLREFKKNPEIFPREVQLEALRALSDSNWVKLQSFECFIGTSLDSIVITKSGLLAAAHLGGVKSVRRFILSNCKYIIVDGVPMELTFKNKRKNINSKDLFGTSIRDYLYKFQGYEF